MLQPKRTKFRKMHRRYPSGVARKGNSVAFGQFGLQAVDGKWVTARQIEAARIAMTRHIKRGGKVWIRIFPHLSITTKPAETRMGKGKGNPDHWVAVVKAGTVMFEIGGITEDVAKEAMRLAGHKLPMRTRFLKRV